MTNLFHLHLFHLFFTSLVTLVILLKHLILFHLLQPLAVEDWNGENRGYLLEARMSELTAWNIKKQVTDQHAVSYVLSGLEEFTTYDVRVAAFNNIGDSPYSEVVNVTTRESGTLLLVLDSKRTPANKNISF